VLRIASKNVILSNSSLLLSNNIGYIVCDKSEITDGIMNLLLFNYFISLNVNFYISNPVNSNIFY